MVSDEALAFVDLMRKDDLDRRAGNVSSATSADERGEPTHEDVVEQSLQEPQSDSGESTESLQMFQEQNEDSLPAAPVSEVALGTESLQAASEQSDPANAMDALQEDGEPSQPSEAVQSIGDAAAIDSLFSQSDQVQFDSQSLMNEALTEEGVTVTSIGNLSGETVILQPESLPDFEAMLRSFDKDYRPPDPQAGDDTEIPPPPDIPESDPMQSSTEFAEQMVSGMSDEYLAGNRRKA